MILHINHIQPERVALTSSVVSTLISIAGETRIPPRLLENLNVHLDWVQYKANFREAVTLRRATRGEELLPWVEVGVDLRQLELETLKNEFVNALEHSPDKSRDGQKRVYIESFTPMRSSLIWKFNDLFWQHLPLWEAASGKGYDQALPSGKSDANNPEAVADAVADFWTLLKDLENHNQLPPEIFVLEIGVGTGKRAALWLDRFRSLDRERGTQYYPRIRFLLGDYSMPTLNRAMETVREHRELGSFLAVDAVDPFKSLSFLRYKVLSIHLTNVYDNLPTDEIVMPELCAGGRRRVHFRVLRHSCYGIRQNSESPARGRSATRPSFRSRTGCGILAIGVGRHPIGRTICRHSKHSGRAPAGGIEARIVGEFRRSGSIESTIPAQFRRRRKFPEYRSVTASARIFAGPGYFRYETGRLRQNVSRTGKIGRIDRKLGQRRAARAGRRASRIRRAFCAFPI